MTEDRPYDWWMAWREEGWVVNRYWQLIAPSGKIAATVWENGTWHTWDEDGNGGENSSEASALEAMRQAMASVLVQGHHTTTVPGSRDPMSPTRHRKK